MKDQIKELKIQIDGLAQLTKELKPVNLPPVITKTMYGEDGNNYPVGCEVNIKGNSKEINKAVDSLYLAKAWLGKVLGEISLNKLGLNFTTFEVNTKEVRDRTANDCVYKNRRCIIKEDKLDVLVLQLLTNDKNDCIETSSNPYGSGYKTKEDIVPTQDVASNFDIGQILYNSFVKDGEVKTSWVELNHIEKVDWLRTEINNLIKSTESLIRDELPCTYPGATMFDKDHAIEKYYEWFFKNSIEARFWLGFELARTKNEK